MRPSSLTVQLHGAVAVDAGQPLEDVGIDHLVDGGGSARRRVEVRRLQHHAEHQAVLISLVEDTSPEQAERHQTNDDQRKHQ